VPKQVIFGGMPVNNLRHSETALKHAAVIRSMIDDLERKIQILHIDICTEEERVRVFDKADPQYSVLARSLGARSDNLKTTVADLKQRLTAHRANAMLACG
jgi:hypothetical protein